MNYCLPKRPHVWLATSIVCLVIFILLSCRKQNDKIGSGEIFTTTAQRAVTASLPDLIAYKNSPHKKAVGYFNGVTRVRSPDYYNLRDVPDSVDIVNIFHQFAGLWSLKRGQRPPGATGENAKTLTEILSDIEYLHLRGTKVILTIFPNEITNNYKDAAHTIKWGTTNADYQGFAKQVYDSLSLWGFDGVDIDVESGTGGSEAFINAFAMYFGVVSGKDKLLIMDTNYSFTSLGFSASVISKLDYLYIQDYFGSQSSTSSKIDGFISNGYSKDKIMHISADFETDYTQSGGISRFINYYSNTTFSNKVGGFGAYGFNFDSKNNYKVYRDLIKFFNSATTGGISPTSGPLVSGGIYRIVTTLNGTSVLNVNSTTPSNGTLISLQSLNNPATNNQKFLARQLSSGEYIFKSMADTSKVMAVAGAASANGTQVRVWAYDNGPAQRWTVTDVGSGNYSLTPACATGSRLDVNASGTANGTKIQIYSSNSTNAQKFKLVKL